MEMVPEDRSSGIVDTLKQISSNKNDIQTILKNSVENSGICSMSATEKNVLMWSHYADEHRGICFGFNGFNIKERINGYDNVSISPVYYLDVNPMYRAVTNFINMIYSSWLIGGIMRMLPHVDTGLLFYFNQLSASSLQYTSTDLRECQKLKNIDMESWAECFYKVYQITKKLRDDYDHLQ